MFIQEHKTAVIKWSTPEEEMSSLARMVAMLVRSREIRSERTVFLTPSTLWAQNMHKACSLASLRSKIAPYSAKDLGAHSKVAQEVESGYVLISTYDNIPENMQLVFALSCVDSLVDDERAQAISLPVDTCNVVFSTFQQIALPLAQQLQIAFTRQKTVNNKTYACCKPSALIEKYTLNKTSTLSGQQIMRDLKLN